MEESYEYERLTVGILKQLIDGLDDYTELRVWGDSVFSPLPIIETQYDKDNNVLELYI